MTITAEGITWTAVCALDDLIPGLPQGALLDGTQLCVVRRRDGSVHAVSNWDPVARAMVLARGIVGDVQGEPMIASPVYKQRYSLRTGRCLDDPALRITVFPVRISDGSILIGT